MNDIRPILYGVSDYAEIRKSNAWFVDRTAKIRDLEKVRYAMFLRPRRFGKSLLCSILEAYYDIDCEGRFDELFHGTDIGANPTEERNKYLMLRFDFSAVDKNVGRVQSDFDYKVSVQCDFFARKYRDQLHDGVLERILAAPDGGKKLSEIMSGLRESGRELYIIVDEYDNFTNTILAESGLNAYNDLCHGDGFFKQFFTELKALTTSLDAPLKRLFITGVSPVTMDDVTSGFNIGTNISLDPVFADFTGFRHDDLNALVRYYAPLCGFDADKAGQVCLEWFDNYRFGNSAAPPLTNTTLVLNFFDKLVRARMWPDDYIDENIRTDYAKIKHLITLSHRLDASERKLNGNFGVLEDLVSGGALTEPLIKSFQAQSLTKKENFTSLLYWLGIATITGGRFGKTTFGIPNETLKKLAADMIPAAYADIHKIDERVFDINDGLCIFADSGDWRKFVGILAEIVKENFRVRDSIDGEKTVQSTVVALLCAAAGPYLVHHEGEAGGGFYDIALEPQLSRWPEIAHAALIEMKYVKAGDPAPAPDQLADIKAKAIAQLDRYSADPELAAKWQLKGMQNAECRMQNGECTMHNAQCTMAGGGTTLRPQSGHLSPEGRLNAANGGVLRGDSARGAVALHRLALVFHGGDCLLAEEV